MLLYTTFRRISPTTVTAGIRGRAASIVTRRSRDFLFEVAIVGEPEAEKEFRTEAEIQLHVVEEELEGQEVHSKSDLPKPHCNLPPTGRKGITKARLLECHVRGLEPPLEFVPIAKRAIYSNFALPCQALKQH